MPLSMIQNNQTYYLHYDQLGRLRAVSDDSLNILKEIRYDTYGNILTETNPSLKVPFGFAGGLYDHDTKLTRFGYRDYDAYTGKWMAKDPIDFAGGDFNLYGYVLGDPVGFVDPDGLLVKELIFAAGLYLAYETWSEYFIDSIENIDENRECLGADDYYDNFGREYKERSLEQLEMSRQTGKDGTIDIMTRGIPFGSRTQTGIDIINESAQ